MRWIVTGALGFVGKNLILQLLANDEYVVGIDRKTIEDETVFARELELLGKDGNFEFHRLDHRVLCCARRYKLGDAAQFSFWKR